MNKTNQTYKLCFFVPESHLSIVKSAVFAAGAGKIGAYDSCCWQVRGEGMFRPLAGSHPAIGCIGVVESVIEYKVEMVCEASLMPAVLQALHAAHPYEEPAFDVVSLVSIDRIL